jgi:hypothetical protein
MEATNQHGCKPIIQIDGLEIKEWPSVKKAADHLHIHPSNITKVLKGNQLTAGGFEFKYKL